MRLLIFMLVCLAGQILQTTTGFGFAIVVMAVASALYPVTELASTCMLLSLGSCAWLTFRYRKKVRIDIILWQAASMMVFSTLAIFTTRYIPVQMLKGILGLVLMALSIYLLAFQSRIRIRPTRLSAVLSGGCGGLLSGYFSTGGPPIVIYLLAALDDKETYLACVQAVFFINNVVNTVGRAAAGQLTGNVLRLALLGYVSTIAGIAIGTRLVSRLDLNRLRRIAYLFIGLSGAWIVLSTWIL